MLLLNVLVSWHKSISLAKPNAMNRNLGEEILIPIDHMVCNGCALEERRLIVYIRLRLTRLWSGLVIANPILDRRSITPQAAARV